MLINGDNSAVIVNANRGVDRVCVCVIGAE